MTSAPRSPWRLYGVLLAFLTIWIAISVVPYLERSPLVFLDQPYAVDGPVAPGGAIPIHIKRCSNTDEPKLVISGRTIRNVETGRSYSLDSGFPVMDPGCPVEALVTTSVVPTQTPPGTYVLTGIVRINGTLRPHDAMYQSVPFEVRAP